MKTVTPAQVRMARAAVNWSLDQLAQAAGVHRNTIHNFETGRYSGSPEKLRAVRVALQKAGVEFIGEADNAGVRLCAPGASEKLQAGALAVAGTAGAAAAISQSILVVNSSKDASLARSILEELRFNVIEAESGEEALLILQEQALNLSAVFTDVMMPGMDGVVLANIVMKTWPAIKVILSTGAASVMDRQLPPNTEMISKPWRVSEMFRLFKGV